METTPTATPLHSAASLDENEPTTPRHQTISNPLVCPGAPRKPTTLKHWVRACPEEDSVDLRDFFIGLPLVKEDFNFPRTDRQDGPGHNLDELLPPFTGSLFTTPIPDDYRTGSKRPPSTPEHKNGKKRCLGSVPTFAISCNASLLELEEPDIACPPMLATPEPTPKMRVRPAALKSTAPFPAATLS